MNNMYVERVIFKTRGKCIKARFFDFSPNFSTQMNVSLPVEGNNVAYQWKGLDQSNNECEYEVNRLTNEKVIRGKRNFKKINNARPPTR